MAYVITDSCVACGTCAGECPAGAIAEGDIYVIGMANSHAVFYAIHGAALDFQIS